MEEKTRILIVEDDMIIAANISLQLTNLGYEVTGIESRGEEAIMHAKTSVPDIILMDINLKGHIDGIATAEQIQQVSDIPIVYLTANTDDATFSRAKATHPFAFVPKPLNAQQLRRTIALLVARIKEKKVKKDRPQSNIQILHDRIFVRKGGKMIKLLLDDILYIEADRNYCNIVTQNGNYLLSSTLKMMEDKLPRNHFLRVHRSYIINISRLDVVGEGHLEIKRKVIPLSRSHREFLFDRIQTI
ncbi:LytR/AlgR family response regulator transcription factor [Spongiimicrobium sp. 3-5]|uniref:LytR/AlgR family response regulator transcription factor n=1 Tax=Spongiimicrobium sp. 3-5 TaxID=3332596 RepID=UPI0039813467